MLVGVGQDDKEEDCAKLAQKILTLRLWPESDEENARQWKSSVVDIQGEVICVSQFTLFAKVKKGTKPDFHGAQKGETASDLYQRVRELVAKGLPGGEVGDGVFGAMMDVSLVNDGPVTINYDTKSKD